MTKLLATLAEDVMAGAKGAARDIAAVEGHAASLKLLSDAVPAAGATSRALPHPEVAKWLRETNNVFKKDAETAHLGPAFSEPENPYMRELEKAYLTNFAPKKPDLRVLEIGPDASSTVPLGFADRMSSYTAVEISASSLRGFEHGLREKGVDMSKTHLIRANGVDLPIKDGSQDVVYMAGASTAHLPWKAGSDIPDAHWTPRVADHALAEAARVLAPGGKVVYRPWGDFFQSQVDMSVFGRHFSKVEVQSLPESSIDAIAPFAKYPDGFVQGVKSGEFKALVLTK